jgi:hypothetical protein
VCVSQRTGVWIRRGRCKWAASGSLDGTGCVWCIAPERTQVSIPLRPTSLPLSVSTTWVAATAVVCSPRPGHAAPTGLRSRRPTPFHPTPFHPTPFHPTPFHLNAFSLHSAHAAHAPSAGPRLPRRGARAPRRGRDRPRVDGGQVSRSGRRRAKAARAAAVRMERMGPGKSEHVGKSQSVR